MIEFKTNQMSYARRYQEFIDFAMTWIREKGNTDHEIIMVFGPSSERAFSVIALRDALVQAGIVIDSHKSDTICVAGVTFMFRSEFQHNARGCSIHHAVFLHGSMWTFLESVINCLVEETV